jgi:hypothetical protein
MAALPVEHPDRIQWMRAKDGLLAEIERECLD